MVMSKLSAGGFGIYSSSNKDKDAVACVGNSSDEIKNCIVDVKIKIPLRDFSKFLPNTVEITLLCYAAP